MKPLAIVAAASAAVVGAIIWGVIAYATGYEIGFIAWGIGGLVGGGAAVMGGRGPLCAAICAVFAIVSIFSGKMIATNAIVKKEINTVSASFDKAAYDETVTDAEAFAKIEENDIPAFMVEHEYTEAPDAKQVMPDEVSDFKETKAPHLRWVAEKKPSFQAWQANRKQMLEEAVLDKISIFQITFENLGLMDIIFGLLGIATAYRLGMGREEASTYHSTPRQPTGTTDAQ